jgi:hypothetical protein
MVHVFFVNAGGGCGLLLLSAMLRVCFKEKKTFTLSGYLAHVLCFQVVPGV